MVKLSRFPSFYRRMLLSPQRFSSRAEETDDPNVEPPTVLRFTSHNLTTLPNSLFVSLFTEHLVELDVAHNKLHSLPNQLSELRHLNTLICSDNQLQQVDICLRHLSKLEYVDLSRNWIVVMPVWLNELRHLRYFNISRNRVAHFEPSLLQCPNLKQIHCIRNVVCNVPPSVYLSGVAALREFFDVQPVAPAVSEVRCETVPGVVLYFNTPLAKHCIQLTASHCHTSLISPCVSVTINGDMPPWRGSLHIPLYASVHVKDDLLCTCNGVNLKSSYWSLHENHVRICVTSVGTFQVTLKLSNVSPKVTAVLQRNPAVPETRFMLQDPHFLDSLSLDVPAHALPTASPVPISLERVPTESTVSFLSEERLLAGPLLSLEPHAIQFASAVTLTLPLVHTEEVIRKCGLNKIEELLQHLVLIHSDTSLNVSLPQWKPLSAEEMTAVRIWKRPEDDVVCVTVPLKQFCLLTAVWNCAADTFRSWRLRPLNALSRIFSTVHFPMRATALISPVQRREEVGMSHFSLAVVLHHAAHEKFPKTDNFPLRVGSTLVAQQLRMRSSLVIRVCSSRLRADAECGEIEPLAKREFSFTGLEVEKQFACCGPLEMADNSCRGQFGKVFVEQWTVDRGCETVMEFNLFKKQTKRFVDVCAPEPLENEEWPIKRILELGEQCGVSRHNRPLRLARLLGLSERKRRQLKHSPRPFSALLAMYQSSGGAARHFLHKLYTICGGREEKANEVVRALLSPEPESKAELIRFSDEEEEEEAHLHHGAVKRKAHEVLSDTDANESEVELNSVSSVASLEEDVAVAHEAIVCTPQKHTVEPPRKKCRLSFQESLLPGVVTETPPVSPKGVKRSSSVFVQLSRSPRRSEQSGISSDGFVDFVKSVSEEEAELSVAKRACRRKLPPEPCMVASSTDDVSHMDPEQNLDQLVLNRRHFMDLAMTALARHCELVAPGLGISPTQFAALKHAYGAGGENAHVAGALYETCYQMLLTWQQRCPEECTLGQLCRVLCEDHVLVQAPELPHLAHSFTQMCRAKLSSL